MLRTKNQSIFTGSCIYSLPRVFMVMFTSVFPAGQSAHLPWRCSACYVPSGGSRVWLKCQPNFSSLPASQRCHELKCEHNKIHFCLEMFNLWFPGVSAQVCLPSCDQGNRRSEAVKRARCCKSIQWWLCSDKKKVRKDEQLGDMRGWGLSLPLAESVGVKRWRQRWPGWTSCLLARARVRWGSWQSKGWHLSPPVPNWAVGCHRFDPWLVLWFPMAHQGCRLWVNSTLGVFAVRARPGACLSCPRAGWAFHPTSVVVCSGFRDTVLVLHHRALSHNSELFCTALHCSQLLYIKIRITFFFLKRDLK